MENKLRRKVVILILLANFLLLNSNFMIVFAQEGSGFSINEEINAGLPPNEPSDPSPDNNSYGLKTSVELSVYVSDPEGDKLSVIFYNASNDSEISSPKEGENGTFYLNWTGLSKNYRYFWYVIVSDGSNSVTSDTWTFSTSSIDSINITDTPGGTAISDKKVSAGFEERVNCSAYNQTEGYIGTVFANWTAEGGDSYLLHGNGTDENTINVGSIGGDVWLNASYDNNNFTDSVLYTVKSPTIDYIEIVDTQTNGSEPIENVTIPIYSSITGYSAAFNNSIGYMEDVDVNWSVTNDGSNAATSPNVQSNSSILDSGDLPGQAVWTAEYNESINDTVNVTIYDDIPPELSDQTTDEPSTGDIFQFKANVTDEVGVSSVFVRYQIDDGQYSNNTMVKSTTEWTYEIQLLDSATSITYNFEADDTSDNWNSTSDKTLSILDNDPSSISITTSETPTTGESYNITANVTDNIAVAEVWLEYIITEIDGNIVTGNVTMDEGSWYKEIEIPNDAVDINYTIKAVDSSGNWNSSNTLHKEITDDVYPNILLNMVENPTAGEEYTFNITVDENIHIDNVTLKYWTDVTDIQQDTMSIQDGKFYISTVQIPLNSQILHYNFTAVDSSGNKNQTTDHSKSVIDNTSPYIISSNVSPSPTNIYLDTNFTCEVSDNINVSSVYINIFGPDDEKLGNYSMSSKELFYYSHQFQEVETYSYHISAVDSSGNWIKSETNNMEVQPPKIDYIRIRNRSDNQGLALTNITLEIEESITLYAAGYNDTYGYQRDLTASWASSNIEAMTIDNEYGISTNCTPVNYGSGKIYAIYSNIQTSIDFEVIESQNPEIIGEIPELTFEEDFGIYQMNLSEYASDLQDSKSALKWYITGLDEDLITLAGENLTGNHQLNLISQKNKFGSMKVTYWLVDSDGNKANQTTWINITSENDPPVFSDFPDLFVRYGKPYPFDYTPYISDSDDPKDQIQLTTDDPTHTDVNGLKVTFEYPEDMINETVFVTLTASDGSESNSRVVRVTVTADYPPENVRSLPDIVLKENETKKNVFDLDDYIQDPDEDSLYMSYGYTQLDITIHDNHSVDIKAPKFWNGLERVTFRATDPIGAVIEQTINVTVTPVNSPPEMKPLPSFKVHYEHPYNFDLRWYISDPDNNLNELEITTSNPSNVSVVGTTLRMIYPKKYKSMEYPYTVPLTVNVSDGLNSTSRITNVTVTDNYPPNIIVPLNDVIFDEDTTVENAFDLDEHFRDRDSETVYYTSGNENIIVDIEDDHTVDFSAPTNWHGSELITIRATDSEGALMEDTFRVFVLPVNDAPIIDEIPDQSGEVGNDWVLDLTSYISDYDDELEELTVSVNTSNIIVAGHKLIFTYPRRSMKESVQITVSDGSLENSTSMNVTILESEEEETQSLFDSPYIFAPIPLLILLFGLIFYIRKGEYTVDDIFLIHDSGILIAHTSREMKEDRDEDILAGMFTAVQNFVKDAFAEDEDESLKRMEYGDKKVLIHKGDYVTLAVFFTGQEPKWALESMENLVNDVEDRYEGDIEDWSGNKDDLPGVSKMIKAMLEKGKYKTDDWEDIE